MITDRLRRLRGDGGGITLVESLVVVAVVALLIILLVPYFLEDVRKSQDNDTKRRLALAFTVASQEAVKNGAYPETDDLISRLERAFPSENFREGLPAKTEAIDYQIGIDTDGDDEVVLCAKSPSGRFFSIRSILKGASRATWYGSGDSCTDGSSPATPGIPGGPTPPDQGSNEEPDDWTPDGDDGGNYVQDPVNLTLPAITGAALDGEVITSSNGTWDSRWPPSSFTYVWYRCDSNGTNCAEIAGTTNTHTLTPGDLNMVFKTDVTAHTEQGGSSTVTSTPYLAADPPVNTALPTISGTPQSGDTLTASNGSWDGTPPFNFTHQWRRCDNAGSNCADISGATAQTYVVQVGDIGSTIRVRVTATNLVGSASATSAQTSVVMTGPPVNTAPPTITGTAQDGQTLTGNPGTWTTDGPTTYEDKWQRCDASGSNCVDIPGATDSTYEVQPADVGSTIRYCETATNVGGSTGPVCSDPTAVVVGSIPSNTAPPVVSNVSRPGNGPRETDQLSTTNGTWTGTPPLSYTYQWRRCDSGGNNCANIAGATSQTYTVQAADVGSTLRSRVTATNTGGSASQDSTQTAVVTALPPQNTVAPTISGTTQDGETLTGNQGTWTGVGPITYDYQWQRCDASGQNCVDIPGATSGTIVLTAGDIGSTITFCVTATNVAGSTEVCSAASGVVQPAPPVNTALPTISGTPNEGFLQTGTNGTWTGTAPITYTYQWRRCDASGSNCSNISGATSQTYTAVAADVNNTLRIVVTATNAGGSASATSAQTAVITPSPPVNTSPPTISGITRDGETLTGDVGVWGGSAPITYTYQWRRCDASGSNCSNISGATNITYLLTASDVGSTIRFQVTGTNGGGNSSATSVQTAVIDPAPPVNTALPVISGTALDGEILTTTNGTWTGTSPITYTYQWRRCDNAGSNCSNISGATNQNYTLTPSDVDKRLRVVVTATNAGGSTPATSAASGVVQAIPPANTVAPTFSGTLTEGETLTGEDGTWTGTPPLTYTYQWQRCTSTNPATCSNIAGATSSTYTLVAADVANYIRFAVTASNATLPGGGSATAYSTVSGSAVAMAPPVNTAPPVVSGTNREGETLSTTNGTWTSTGAPSFAYAWLRCDDAGANCSTIAGATSSTYVLVAADVASTIRSRVTATNAGGSASQNSSQTELVYPLAPVNTSPPVASPVGVLQVGQVMNAANGTWTSSAPIAPPRGGYSYQWQRCDTVGDNCANISGATSQGYTLVAADEGSSIRVVVTARNWGSGGSSPVVETSATSEPATGGGGTPPIIVLPAPPINVTPPEISPDPPVIGGTETTTNGTWTGTPPITYTYQWYRCVADGSSCSPISGQTSQTYVPTDSDGGYRLRTQVTATNAGGSTGAYSAMTNPIAVQLPVGTILPVGQVSSIDGWLVADGSSVSQATYADLYAAIGCTFGCSGGNFTLPNMTGRFPYGTNGAPGATGGSLSDSPGSSFVSLGGGSSSFSDPGGSYVFSNHQHTVNINGHGVDNETGGVVLARGYSALATGFGGGYTATLSSTTISVTIGSSTGSVSYGSADVTPPYQSYRFIVKASSTAQLPCGLVIWTATASAPSDGNSALANGGTGAGCLGFNPNLRDRFPYGTNGAAGGTGGSSSHSHSSSAGGFSTPSASAGSHSHTMSQPPFHNHSANVQTIDPKKVQSGSTGWARGFGANVTSNQPAGSYTSASPTASISGGGTPSTSVNASTHMPSYLGLTAYFKTSAGGGIPTGAVISYAGTVLPTGYRWADGSSVSQATFAALYAAIGCTFGCSGSNFNLPNMTSRIPIGAGGSYGLGSSGGSTTHGHNVSVGGRSYTVTLAGHSHTLTYGSHTHLLQQTGQWNGEVPCFSSCFGAAYAGARTSSAYSATGTTTVSGGSNGWSSSGTSTTAFGSNLPPYLALRFAIKT